MGRQKDLFTNKPLLKNELMKELMLIRLDTMWRMLSLAKKGLMPKTFEEGATGEFDNKGALFIPGGIVFEDSDKRMIEQEKLNYNRKHEFRRVIRKAMLYDNATLFYQNGLARGINLDNGFFTETASNIIINKRMALKKAAFLKINLPERIDSNHITISHVPDYVPPPYGSRTKLSSCLAVCLEEPGMFFLQCRAIFGLRDKKLEEQVWENIRSALQPVKKEKTIFAPPCIIVCHTTRYKENNLTGMTRILGYGKFGEFATLSLERVNTDLLSELKKQELILDNNQLVAEFGNHRIVCILRMYAPTRPGRRFKKFKSRIINLKQEFNIDTGQCNAALRKKYLD